MENVIGHTLCKEERLYHKSRFDALLSSGNSFISYPCRVVFLITNRQEGDFPARVAISVSKKRFKRAVKRNRVKRLLREAYRLRKGQLYSIIPENKTMDILFIYLHDTIGEYAKFDKAVSNAIKKIGSHIEKHIESDFFVVD